MSKAYQMYFDEEGYPRINFKDLLDSRSLIGLFLMTDVGSDISYCEELVNLTESIMKSRSDDFNGAGNLFELNIQKDHIAIENLYDEEKKLEMPAQNFLEILTDWCNLIRKHEVND